MDITMETIKTKFKTIESKQKSVSKLMNCCDNESLRQRVMQSSIKLRSNRLPNFFTYLAYMEAQWLGTKLWKEVPILIEGNSFSLADRKDLAKLNKAYAMVRNWVKNVTDKKGDAQKDVANETRAQMGGTNDKKKSKKEKKPRRRIIVEEDDDENELDEKSKTARVDKIEGEREIIVEDNDDGTALEKKKKSTRVDKIENERREIIVEDNDDKTELEKKRKSAKVDKMEGERRKKGREEKESDIEVINVTVEDESNKTNEESGKSKVAKMEEDKDEDHLKSKIIVTTIDITDEDDNENINIEEDMIKLQRLASKLEDIKDQVVEVQRKARKITNQPEALKYRIMQLELARQRISLSTHTVSSFRVGYKECDEQRFFNVLKNMNKNKTH